MTAVVRTLIVALVVAAFGLHHVPAVGAAGPVAHHAPACATCGEESGVAGLGDDVLGLCVAVLTAVLALPGLRRRVRLLLPAGFRGAWTARGPAAGRPAIPRARSAPVLCVLLR
jgi:hypothetical protein